MQPLAFSELDDVLASITAGAACVSRVVHEFGGVARTAGQVGAVKRMFTGA